MMSWTLCPSMQQRVDLVPVQNASFNSREILYILFFFPHNIFCMKVKLPYKGVPMLWLWDLSSHGWSVNSLSTEHVLASQMSCLCPWPTSTTLGKGEVTLFYLFRNLAMFYKLSWPDNIQPLAKPISSNPKLQFGFGFLSSILMSNLPFLI